MGSSPPLPSSSLHSGATSWGVPNLLPLGFATVSRGIREWNHWSTSSVYDFHSVKLWAHNLQECLQSKTTKLWISLVTFFVCVKRPRTIPNQHRHTRTSKDDHDGTVGMLREGLLKSVIQNGNDETMLNAKLKNVDEGIFYLYNLWEHANVQSIRLKPRKKGHRCFLQGVELLF